MVGAASAGTIARNATGGGTILVPNAPLPTASTSGGLPEIDSSSVETDASVARLAGRTDSHEWSARDERQGDESGPGRELRGPELLRAAVRQRGEPVLGRAARSGPLRRQRQGRRDRERRVSGLGHARPRAHEPDRPQHAVRLRAGDRPLGPECRARSVRRSSIRAAFTTARRGRSSSSPARSTASGRRGPSRRLDRRHRRCAAIRRRRTPCTRSTRRMTPPASTTGRAVTRGHASRTIRTSEPTATGSTSRRTCSTSSGRLRRRQHLRDVEVHARGRCVHGPGHVVSTNGDGPDFGTGFTCIPAVTPADQFDTANGGTEYFVSSRAVFTNDGTVELDRLVEARQHELAELVDAESPATFSLGQHGRVRRSGARDGAEAGEVPLAQCIGSTPTAAVGSPAGHAGSGSAAR